MIFKRKLKIPEFTVYVGIAITLLGIIISSYIIHLWLKNKNFNFSCDSTLADLGTILSGTSGVLFTLAGVLFFTYTLYQTRQEMKENRDIMMQQKDILEKQSNLSLNQQYQTTFFSLLNAHHNLIKNINFDDKKGLDGLDKMYLDFTVHIPLYNRSLEKEYFERGTDTTYNPLTKLLANRTSVEVFLDEIITLLKFLDEKLDDILYYEIVYNSLSVSERFLIGIYCDCFNDSYSDYFLKCKLDFKKYYNSLPDNQKYNLTLQNYLPQIKIIRAGNGQTLNESEIDLKRSFFEFKLKELRNWYGKSLSLNCIEIKIYDNDLNALLFANVFGLEELKDIMNRATGDYVVNILPLILKIFQRMDRKYWCRLEVLFGLQYDNRTFFVKYMAHMEVDIYSDESFDLSGKEFRLRINSEIY